MSNLPFLCRVEKHNSTTDNQHEYIVNVVLDFSKIPTKEDNQKLVYSSLLFNVDDILYVSKSLLEVMANTKKMMILEAYSLSKITLPENKIESEISVQLSDTIKEVIENSSKFPIDLYKNNV